MISACVKGNNFIYMDHKYRININYNIIELKQIVHHLLWKCMF